MPIYALDQKKIRSRKISGLVLLRLLCYDEEDEESVKIMFTCISNLV